MALWLPLPSEDLGDGEPFVVGGEHSSALRSALAFEGNGDRSDVAFAVSII